MTRIKLTKTQVKILAYRTEIPECIFDVFSDTEPGDRLLHEYTEERIIAVSKMLLAQYAKGYLDIDELCEPEVFGPKLFDRLFVIEILDDVCDGSCVFGSTDDWPPQKVVAWKRATNQLEEKFEELGLLAFGGYTKGKIRRVSRW